ncbi:MAG TPA: hypothetical protein VKR55_06360 [Bradyrhizobium sp.]|uniref:hypothetical protein n=1 Tax=Bradyrhizobium sp. TaxID=376 RepID=UPI002B967A45|nr:hypothetical protein [Bradyrhizobium sp.]HLZ01761.1 hypothetical protein [Bradyrhizobium sp.]
MPVDKIWDFLQRLTPLTRSCLLAELERLELSGVDMPGSADIQAKLRAEFRKDGSTQNREGQPSRYFFAPLDPLLTDGAPEHPNSGRIPRGSLAPIWEWINRDLLPTMARDFNTQMRELIALDKQKEAGQAAFVFQTKVVKYLESTLGDRVSAEATRAKLGTYTAARSAFGDLVKIMHALRAREAIAKFNKGLPERFGKFDDGAVARMTARLDAFGKDNADALPFAIALIGRRLKTQWQLVRLATKAAPSKNAADVAATPYAIAVSMVLDRIDDGRAALRIALKQNRVLIARDLLAEIYDTEYALKVRIDQFDQSEWGVRLKQLMDAIAELVAVEVSRFPEKVGHVLGSRRLRSHESLAGKLTYLAWKGRDALTNGATYCKRLINAA